MAADARTCPACGARVAADAPVCDLCGHAFDAPDADDLAEPVVLNAPPAPAAEGAVFCTACGQRNPGGARFCARCGTPLQALDAPAAPGPARASGPYPAVPAAAPPAAPEGLGRRLGVLVGAAVLLVVGLYFVTVASRNARPAGAPGADTTAATAPGSGAAPAGAPPSLGPLSAEVEAQVTALQEQVDAASGAAKQTKQRELVNLLIGVGRPDRAAEVQEALATTTAAPADWKRAGDLLYGWMELLPEDGRPPVAARVIAAYDRVLAADADDLDARTNLGWAAQYAGDNPMRAITETLAVLGKDSTHVGANYNRAWLLMRIGRTEQAIAQLEKVVRLAGPATPLGREAASMVEQLRAGPPAAGIPAGPTGAPATGAPAAGAPATPSAPGAPAPAP